MHSRTASGNAEKGGAVELLDDAEAIELGMPRDAWIGLTTTRAGHVYQLIDVSNDVDHEHRKWRRIGPA